MVHVFVLNVPLFPADPQSGELLIKNHTDSNVGTYMCEVTNAVGKSQCQYQLNAYNRKSIVSFIFICLYRQGSFS